MTGKDTDESTHVMYLSTKCSISNSRNLFIGRKTRENKDREYVFPKQGNRDEGSGLVMILHGYGYQYCHKKLLFYQTVISNV